ETAAGMEVVGREIPFVLALPRLFLHGRIDVLARRDGVHVVRDYKYARSTEGAVENYAPQLGAYRLSVLAAGGGPVEAELVFLRGGTTVRPVPCLDAAREEAALVEAAARLGRALASGAPDAFLRTPPG